MAKKNFGSVVTEEVKAPVEQHRAERPVQVTKAAPKYKMVLDQTNATKRTFLVREDVSQEFDTYAFVHRMDKGALLNLALHEWMEQNKNREDFQQF